MNAGAAEKLAKCLLRLHGLKEWRLEFEDTLDFYGLCDDHKKIITLSNQFVATNEAANVVDTVLHEVAHALVGNRHSHGPVWRSKCEEIGARPRATQDECIPGRWQARCENCGKWYSFFRKPKNTFDCSCPAAVPLEFVDVSTIDNPQKKGFRGDFVKIPRKSKTCQSSRRRKRPSK